jgi:predicted transcriptional regulator
MFRFFDKSMAGENPLPSLGPLELAVLDTLWTSGEANVHEVARRLDRPLAYTTVMTTLDRLFKKGLLNRRKSDRAFLYSPRFSRQEWEQKRASDLVAGFFSAPNGSGEMLVSFLVEAVGNQDEALLDELERRIRARRRELDQRGKP